MNDDCQNIPHNVTGNVQNLMKSLKHILRCLTLLLIAPVASTAEPAGITPGNCQSFTVSGPQVVFHCESDVNVMLKLCAPGIIKFWYEQGTFNRSNESFAVINEDIDNHV